MTNLQPTPIYYATLDSEAGHIEEDAHIASFKTYQDSVLYLAHKAIDYLEPGEVMTYEAGDFSDCWIKSIPNPENGCLQEWDGNPFSVDDMMIQRPGDHPGGKVYWVTPRHTVLVRVTTKPFSDLEDLLEAMQHGTPDWSNLPSFGGDDINEPGVWSWNETHMIAGECSQDVEIVPRNYLEG